MPTCHDLYCLNSRYDALARSRRFALRGPFRLADRKRGVADFGEEGGLGAHGARLAPSGVWTGERRDPIRSLRWPSSGEGVFASVFKPRSPLCRLNRSQMMRVRKWNEVQKLFRARERWSYGLFELFELYFFGGGGHPSRLSALLIVFFDGRFGFGNNAGKRSLALPRTRRSISALVKLANSLRSISSRTTSRTLGIRGGRPIFGLFDGTGWLGGVSFVDSSSAWIGGSWDGSGSFSGVSCKRCRSR
jgi:hypothetical protein